MMNKDLLKKDLHRIAAILTAVTNCFIISGVVHHWRPRVKDTNINNEWNNTYRYTNDNTQLAETFKEATQIQKETTYGTGCKEAYQNAN